MGDFNERIEKLNQIISESNKICFFGGAGVSTESGIPDFRSKDGLYNTMDAEFDKYEPEFLLSHTCLYQHPKVFYTFFRQKMDVRNFKPNSAHYKLAELESKGKMVGVVTQNIDGLHQKAGSEKVYEIHGNVSKNYCTYCGDIEDDWYIFDSKELIPQCQSCCKGMIRPDVVLYDEILPKDVVNMASQAIYEADCLIVAGTSLQVTPAASMVNGFYGKYLVVINRESVGPIEKYADVVFRENIGEVMSKIIV